ncbi:MAG TPA: molybdopterin converting factor subunit 1 [Gemmataceae bacterium]|nr:molybdopterin converting factor subunit 1 [Gemmataceae bacterium]
MKILLFARARDLVGTDRIELTTPASATIGELRSRLAAQYPQLASLLAKSAFAVNDAYADDATPIPLGAEVALLPPVSGG